MPEKLHWTMNFSRIRVPITHDQQVHTTNSNPNTDNILKVKVKISVRVRVSELYVLAEHSLILIGTA